MSFGVVVFLVWFVVWEVWSGLVFGVIHFGLVFWVWFGIWEFGFAFVLGGGLLWIDDLGFQFVWCLGFLFWCLGFLVWFGVCSF